MYAKLYLRSTYSGAVKALYNNAQIRNYPFTLRSQPRTTSTVLSLQKQLAGISDLSIAQTDIFTIFTGSLAFLTILLCFARLYSYKSQNQKELEQRECLQWLKTDPVLHTDAGPSFQKVRQQPSSFKAERVDADVRMQIYALATTSEEGR